MPKAHFLKTDPEPFQAVKARLKRFEIRVNDRDFKVGDRLVLLETEFTGHQMKTGFHPLRYTNEAVAVDVIHIMAGPTYGLGPGWVIMSITDPVSA